MKHELKLWQINDIEKTQAKVASATAYFLGRLEVILDHGLKASDVVDAWDASCRFAKLDQKDGESN